MGAGRRGTGVKARALGGLYRRGVVGGGGWLGMRGWVWKMLWGVGLVGWDLV